MEDSKFVFKKWAKPGLFLFFSEPSNKYIANFDHGKSVNGELGIRTRTSKMVGADKFTELWCPLYEHSKSVSRFG